MALQMFERSIDLDPEFAAAYAELSRSYAALYHFGYDREESTVKKALDAALHALELKRGLSEGHFALGTYYYWIKRDYEQSLEHLKIAEKALPNDFNIKWLIAAITKRTGNFEAALRQQRELLERSPTDPLAAHGVALTCLLMRRNQEADAQYSQSIIQNPDQEFGYLFRALNFWSWRGDLKMAREILEQLPESNKPRTSSYWYIGYLQRLFERDYQGTLNWMGKCPEEYLSQQVYFIPKTLLQAVAYHLMGDDDHMQKLGESARNMLETRLEELPNDHRILGSLGVVYAIMGMYDQAIIHGERGLDLCPPSKDALIGPARVDDMAFIHTLLNEHDEAINQIEILLSIPSVISAPMCRLDPRWDPLRDHPRFQKLLEQYETKEDL
jgi:tetratricopeptide (TPR) repeat protein